jgi:hypothetical protein
MTTMAKVVALPPKPDASADEALRAETRGRIERREALMSEASRLARVDGTRRDVETRLAALDAEQTGLDENEREQWRQWAQRAEGPTPSPRVAEREAIARRRGLLANDLAAAIRGQEAVQPRLAELHAELRELGVQIFAENVEGLLVEAAELHATVHERAAAFLDACQQSDGLRDSISQSLSRAINANASEREAILRSAYSRLDRATMRPILAGDAGKRAEHAAAYLRRLP